MMVLLRQRAVHTWIFYSTDLGKTAPLFFILSTEHRTWVNAGELFGAREGKSHRKGESKSVSAVVLAHSIG